MQFIDMTPTWEEILPVMLMGYRNGASVESIKILEEEFRRMAQAADAYNAICKAKEEVVA